MVDRRTQLVWEKRNGGRANNTTQWEKWKEGCVCLSLGRMGEKEGEEDDDDEEGEDE